MASRRRTFDELHVRHMLRKDAARLGGLEAFARKHGFDERYLAEAASGHTEMSAKLLKVLGFNKVKRFAKARAS